MLSAFHDFAAAAQGSKVWPSIEAWVGVEPDPRVARTALLLLSTPGAIRELTGKLWRRLVNCLEQHGHVGLSEPLRAYQASLVHGTHGGWRGDPARLARVIARLDKTRKPLPVDPEALARLDRAIPKLHAAAPAAPAGGVNPEQLLAAVLATPDEDAPRAMYADALTERGDVRGEFILLQLEKKPSKAARKREAELWAQHRTRFLGPFAKVVRLSGLRFARGFLVKCALAKRLPALALTSLLEDVDFDFAGFDPAARLDRLESARKVSPEELLRLLEIAPRLAEAWLDLDLETPRARWRAWADFADTLGKAKRSLTRLAFHSQGRELGPRLTQLLALPLVSKVESLSLLVSPGSSARVEPVHFAAAPPTLREVSFANSWKLWRLNFTRSGSGWSLEGRVEREPLGYSGQLEALTHALRAFSGTPLARVELAVARPGRLGPVREAAERAGCTKDLVVRAA